MRNSLLVLLVAISVSAQDQPSSRQKEFMGLQLSADQVKEALTKNNLSTASQIAHELSLRVRSYETTLVLVDLERQLPGGGPGRLYPLTKARDLLAVGERDVVLTFFSQCRVFWNVSLAQNKIRDWTETLKTCCRMPNFADNLVY
jgi:hypothetical protein